MRSVRPFAPERYPAGCSPFGCPATTAFTAMRSSVRDRLRAPQNRPRNLRCEKRPNRFLPAIHFSERSANAPTPSLCPPRPCPARATARHPGSAAPHCPSESHRPHPGSPIRRRPPARPSPGSALPFQPANPDPPPTGPPCAAKVAPPSPPAIRLPALPPQKPPSHLRSFPATATPTAVGLNLSSASPSTAALTSKPARQRACGAVYRGRSRVSVRRPIPD
jgi:hypothetical protein